VLATGPGTVEATANIARRLDVPAEVVVLVHRPDPNALHGTSVVRVGCYRAVTVLVATVSQGALLGMLAWTLRSTSDIEDAGVPDRAGSPNFSPRFSSRWSRQPRQ
jgi:hypothetical protein